MRAGPGENRMLDFPSIAKAAGTYAEWMIVEFDENGGDISEGSEPSASFLMSMDLAKGNV